MIYNLFGPIRWEREAGPSGWYKMEYLLPNGYHVLWGVRKERSGQWLSSATSHLSPDITTWGHYGGVFETWEEAAEFIWRQIYHDFSEEGIGSIT